MRNGMKLSGMDTGWARGGEAEASCQCEGGRGTISLDHSSFLLAHPDLPVASWPSGLRMSLAGPAAVMSGLPIYWPLG